MRKEMQLELKEMHKKLGITFIFVTHDQEEALTMSDKVVVMSDGQIQQVGTPEDIYNEPSNLFVADFIGESNIFKGKMVGKKQVEFCGTVFDCVDDYAEDTIIDAVIRPEDVMITEVGKGQMTGEVLICDFKGIFYVTTVKTGKAEMEIHSLKAYKEGEKVGLIIPPDNIHIIPYDTSINHYEGIVEDYNAEKGLVVAFDDFSLTVPANRVFQTAVEKEGMLVDHSGKEISWKGAAVVASFLPEDGTLSDEPDSGFVSGHIFNFIYIDDHYRYRVRSESEEDYIVHSEYLWNQEDYVSVQVPTDKFVFELK